MTLYIYILLGLLSLSLLVWLAWRWGARRRSLPCPSWLHWLVELDNPFTRTNRAGVIIRHLELRPGMVVLDMGCGPGRVTIPLAQQVGAGGKVVAVDIQAGMLQRARDKAQLAGLDNIEFIQAAAGEAGLGHDRFERAVLVSVLGESRTGPESLRRFLRPLNPVASCP